MSATAKKITNENDSVRTEQYSRLQKLLNFKFFDKKEEPYEETQQTNHDDFIDIVLEADFTVSGKVKRLK